MEKECDVAPTWLTAETIIEIAMLFVVHALYPYLALL
jgi:hypothetical protein